MIMFSKFVGSFKSKLGNSNSSLPSPSNSNKQRSGSRRKISFDHHTNRQREPENTTSCGTPGDRNTYCRPHFLQLTKEEEAASLNHSTRPIIVPKDVNQIPLGAGYAECINGGKSPRNEDEAAVGSFVLSDHSNGLTDGKRSFEKLQVKYFAIFDGHAGTGASLMAADQLINHLQEKLVEIQEDIFKLLRQETVDSSRNIASSVITIDSLIRGALEAAFLSFDEQIARERLSINISGGCAAIVALVLLNKLYVAHAGDCRAVIFFGNETIEIATEFTPETDAERIQNLAYINPGLTHSFFSDNYFLSPLREKDIGTRVLYRAPQRAGWHCKEVTDEDVYKLPIVSGRGKWARLMGVIGVTRGFGDHGLVVPNTDIHVKPFMTAVPEVRVFNLADRDIKEDDVMVMGCDGLWDMLSNEQVGLAVKASLAVSPGENSLDRYTRVAHQLVLMARGEKTGRGWKMKNGQEASFDDISAFVIPLHRCLDTSFKK
ncbi:unnamed protein product [Candidula unifasciata]|uniref:PPM-type phosphatase domain-containing protein n=1 Tax=Candidula unifasciata TaxID=100452 RepID=A0A8S3ZFK0_9EUPU|nr:unnamed protein product [Candidula unifasciata]